MSHTIFKKYHFKMSQPSKSVLVTTCKYVTTVDTHANLVGVHCIIQCKINNNKFHGGGCGFHSTRKVQ